MMLDTHKENQIKRLIYQSWYRGCKETDRILGYFVKANIYDFSDEQIIMLEELMMENDADIFAWVTNKNPIPDRLTGNKVLTKLLNFEVSGYS